MQQFLGILKPTNKCSPFRSNTHITKTQIESSEKPHKIRVWRAYSVETNNTKTHENVPLATEIIRTLKRVIYALIILEILTIGGFIYYLSMPVEQETVEISNDTGNASYIGHDGEVVNNGTN